MEITTSIGIIATIFLVIGAFYPIENVEKPVYSVKNWIFTVGSLTMLMYAIAGYLAWWQIFFIYWELLIALACLLMMLDINDRRDGSIITVASIGLFVWGFPSFQSTDMFLFSIAFLVLGLGYVFDMNSIRRYIGLTLWGIFIAISSYVDGGWTFFWLNLFFAIFSLYYTILLILARRKQSKKQQHKKKEIKKKK